MRYKIPGLYHDLTVRLLPQKKLGKLMKDAKVIGAYVEDEATIYLSSDLPKDVREHCLYHEISHHILDTLAPIKDEEAKCDLLASYLLKLRQM